MPAVKVRPRTRNNSRAALAAVLLLFCGAEEASAFSAAESKAVRTIGRSDPLRKVLLDALRPAVERDLGQRLIFVVHRLRVARGWAFAEVAPRTPSGGRVDFTRTRHAERLAQGMLDGDTVHALLRRKDGRWTVVTFAIGPTDVVWAEWDDRYGAPPQLFSVAD